MVQITPKDEELLALLKVDSREPVASLARKLGLSRTTVQEYAPPAHRARILSIYQLGFTGGMSIGVVVAAALGLAFVMSAHASFWYVAAMCALVSLVGFSYTIICAHFPDGGGVYSAAKKRSVHLGVIGALLLIADYTITAALSAYEGFRYMLPNGVTPVLVDSSFAVAFAIILEATLSYLGLGPADQASWGRLLAGATSEAGDFVWWLAIFPGLAIFGAALSYNLLGEALRDAIDPKRKKR